LSNTAPDNSTTGWQAVLLGRLRAVAESLESEQGLSPAERLSLAPGWEAWREATDLAQALEALRGLGGEAALPGRGGALVTALNLVLGHLVLAANLEDGEARLLEGAWDERAIHLMVADAFAVAWGQQPSHGHESAAPTEPHWRRQDAERFARRWVRDLLPQAVGWVFLEAGLSLTNSLCRELAFGRAERVLSTARLTTPARELVERLAEVLPLVRGELVERLARSLAAARPEHWLELRPECDELALNIKSHLYSQRREDCIHLLAGPVQDQPQADEQTEPEEHPPDGASMFRDMARRLLEESMLRRLESMGAELDRQGEELLSRLAGLLSQADSLPRLQRFLEGETTEAQLQAARAGCWGELLEHLRQRLPELAGEGVDFNDLPRRLTDKFQDGELDQDELALYLRLWAEARESGPSQRPSDAPAP